MILIIGMVAISLLAISVVLAATAVNVQAHKLLSVADGAVAAAADNFELSAGGGDRFASVAAVRGPKRSGKIPCGH